MMPAGLDKYRQRPHVSDLKRNYGLVIWPIFVFRAQRSRIARLATFKGPSLRGLVYPKPVRSIVFHALNSRSSAG